jgi:pantoate--beta-alanine ligase
VATVVSKLFNIVRPHVAVFGKKDYQQFVIIRRLVKDLNYGIRIVGVPIVRDTDGVAMSSRNTYLSSEERESARSLFKGLQEVQQLVWKGSKDVNALTDHVSNLIHAHPHTKIDYVALCDPETLEAVSRIDGETLMALAVYVGSTRLIDNTVLTLDRSSPK